MYPLRYPLSQLLGSIGVPLLIKVDIVCDKETQVYIATSQDVDGLVVEAQSLDVLKKETLDLIPELLAANKPGLFNKAPCADFSYRQPIAA